MCSEKCNGYFATKCRVQTVADASITMPSGNVLSYKDSPLRYLIDQHRLGAIVSWALRQIRRKAFFDICVLYLVYLIWFHCMIRQWCGKPEGGNSNPDCRKLTLFLSWNRMETLFMKSCWKHEAVYYFVHVTECFDWLKLRLHIAINRYSLYIIYPISYSSYIIYYILYIYWWMWFNGSVTKVRKATFSHECILLPSYLYNMHQDTKSSQLLAACKRTLIAVDDSLRISAHEILPVCWPWVAWLLNRRKLMMTLLERRHLS